jgi:hypothetical protein
MCTCLQPTGTAMAHEGPGLYIMACLLNARIVKPAETAVAMERLRKHAHR